MNGNDLVGTRLCKMGGNCLYHLPVGELVRRTFCWKCGVHKSEDKPMTDIEQIQKVADENAVACFVTDYVREDNLTDR